MLYKEIIFTCLRIIQNMFFGRMYGGFPLLKRVVPPYHDISVHYNFYNACFKVLTPGGVHFLVFRVLTICGVVGLYRRFGETSYLLL